MMAFYADRERMGLALHATRPNTTQEAETLLRQHPFEDVKAAFVREYGAVPRGW